MQRAQKATHKQTYLHRFHCGDPTCKELKRPHTYKPIDIDSTVVTPTCKELKRPHTYKPIDIDSTVVTPTCKELKRPHTYKPIDIEPLRHFVQIVSACWLLYSSGNWVPGQNPSVNSDSS